MRKKKIFISYAREDFYFAEKLFNELSIIPEFLPWLDKKNLLPGAKWKNEIINEIGTSNYVIILLSKNSITKKGFIQKELAEALDQLSYYPPNQIFIIPARIDDCIPLHKELNELHWVDLFDNWADGLRKIILSLNAGSQILDISLDKTKLITKSGTVLGSKFHSFLHKLWTDAIYDDDYDKKEWERFQSLLYNRNLEISDIEEFAFLFHLLWLKAKNSSHYNENNWMEFKAAIEER